MKLEFIDSILVEARAGAQPHPEDSVFDGSTAASQALQNMLAVIKQPDSISIKWDGFPALVFGRVADGKLAVMDKYMFDAKFFATSPAMWQQYDQQKATGRTRPDLYQKVAGIWAGLDQAVGSSPGFFWGDLLWWSKLPVVDGKLVFRPNQVEYRIPVKSQLGQQIAKTVGGVVVHQYFADENSPAQRWNQQGLKTNGSVAILTPNMGIHFKLSDPHGAVKAAKAAVAKGAVIDKFLSGLDGVARTALSKYLNQRVRGSTQADLVSWLQGNVSAKQFKILVGENGSGYLNRQRAGLTATFEAWQAIYNLKLALAQELENQVKQTGIEQYVNGRAQGEGFVYQTPQGLAKLVDKGGFTAAALG